MAGLPCISHASAAGLLGKRRLNKEVWYEVVWRDLHKEQVKRAVPCYKDGTHLLAVAVVHGCVERGAQTYGDVGA